MRSPDGKTSQRIKIRAGATGKLSIVPAQGVIETVEAVARIASAHDGGIVGWPAIVFVTLQSTTRRK